MYSVLNGTQQQQRKRTKHYNDNVLTEQYPIHS